MSYANTVPQRFLVQPRAVRASGFLFRRRPVVLPQGPQPEAL